MKQVVVTVHTENVEAIRGQTFCSLFTFTLGYAVNGLYGVMARALCVFVVQQMHAATTFCVWNLQTGEDNVHKSMCAAEERIMSQ